MKSDSELLRLYVSQRSEAAFTELVNRHIDFVYSVAIRKVGGDSQLAKDVASSVFCDVAKKARNLSLRRDLTGWLYRATHFAAAKLIRTERFRRNVEEQFSTMNEKACAEDTGNDESLLTALDSALLRLGEREREIILLRFFRKQSFAQIGIGLSIAEDAARKRTDRALEKLRHTLSRQVTDLSESGFTTLLSERGTVLAPGLLGVTVAQIALSHTPAASFGATWLAKIPHAFSAKSLTVSLASLTIAGTGAIFYVSHVANAASSDSVPFNKETLVKTESIPAENLSASVSPNIRHDGTLKLTAHGSVVVSVEEVGPDKKPGKLLLSREKLEDGESRSVPWLTPLYITATAFENISIEVNGRQMQVPAKGYTRIHMQAPPLADLIPVPRDILRE